MARRLELSALGRAHLRALGRARVRATWAPVRARDRAHGWARERPRARAGRLGNRVRTGPRVRALVCVAPLSKLASGTCQRTTLQELADTHPSDEIPK